MLTGFQGFTEMVDELGGVDVYVPRNMSDKFSGAYFAQGYHHFNGEQALAFCRDRHSVKYGDFTRSENQGRLILATLGKMRTEVGDDSGLRRWLSVLANHAELDVPASELEQPRRACPSSRPGVAAQRGDAGQDRYGQGRPVGRVRRGRRPRRCGATYATTPRLGGYTPPPSDDDTPDTTDTTDTTVEETTTTTETTDPPIIGGGGGDDTTTSTTSEF